MIPKMLLLFLWILSIGNISNEEIPNTRIIGGTQPLLTTFPFIVDVRLTTSPYDMIGIKTCAGSIINVNYVVTSAFCASYPRARYWIHAGSYDSVIPTLATLQPRRVMSIVLHKGYNADTNENNIAVMRVIPAFIFDGIIQPIPYVHFNFNPNDTVVQIAGWGSRSNNDPFRSRYLMSGSLPLINNSYCQTFYPKRIITPTHLCGMPTNSAPCRGDDGGPVVCTRNNASVLCGLISGIQSSCEIGGLPRIFTRMSPFYSWLQVQTQ